MERAPHYYGVYLPFYRLWFHLQRISVEKVILQREKRRFKQIRLLRQIRQRAKFKIKLRKFYGVKGINRS
jgi:hypothetical protein